MRCFLIYLPALLLLGAGLLTGCARNPEKAAAAAVESLLDADQPMAASDALDACLRQHPESVRLRHLQVIVALRLERPAQALAALRTLPPEDELLAEAIRHPSPVVRSGAAALMAEHKLPVSCEALKAALDDSNAAVRRSAATAMGWRTDCTQVLPLYRLLQDDNSGVRLAAIAAFGQRKEARAAGWLIPLLVMEDPTFRETIERSLWQLASQENRDVFLKAYAKGNPRWQLGLATVLAKFEEPAVLPYLIHTAQRGVTNERSRAALVLGNYSDPGVADLLANLLEDSEAEVREAARLALQKKATPPAPK